MKKILSIFICSLTLNAVEFKEVFNQKIKLDKNSEAILTLREEDTLEQNSNVARIVLNYSIYGKKKRYEFTDTSDYFPIYHFNKHAYNFKKRNIVDLTNGVNVFDVDNNGNNEIFIYGSSDYGGSGYFGKLIILEKNNSEIVQKTKIIKASDNFEIKYIKSDNIIIVAQYIWRNCIESHYGDKHYYKYIIYDIKKNFLKIPLLISKTKISDTYNNIIERDLIEIRKKYALYQEGRLLKIQEEEIKKFVKMYWQNISLKNFDYIENSLSKKVFYYSKELSKKMILNDKKKALQKIKNINFKIDDFLIYKRNNRYIVEYKKVFNIDNNHDFGTVQSIMELKRINGKLLIVVEKDIVIFSLKRDCD